MLERAVPTQCPPSRWRGRLALAFVSLAGHAALLAALLHGDMAPRREERTAPPRHGWQRPLQLRWVRPLSAPRNDAAATTREVPRAVAPETTAPRAARLARAPTAPAVVHAIIAPSASAAAPASRDAVPDGSVFGLPHIAFVAVRAPASRADTAGVATAMPVPMLAQQRMQAAAAHDAARAQVHAALQRELGAWPAIDRAATCHVRAVATDCDDDALRAQLLAHADTLRALLAAMRQLEPSHGALTIEFRDGRYHGAAQSAPAL